ncbi:MAG TPA: translation initiation factor IF-3 [Spirochaetota bacterium]|nr:translation initiation factor IF-3 [Spirochaetota bacterium]HOM39116.1 translation initiation factor IF-3 [Spirochaetota bacterium]HPQ49999.1 translation initiation factor IF-3 [Spirochaetota bacterium]
MIKELNINNQIKAKKVRLVDPDGNQLGVVDINEALLKAKEFNLDLVEIAPQAEPPVCKIMDYGKYRFEQKKKEKEMKKKQHIIQVKELTLTPLIEEHDYQVKLKKAKEFLIRGDKLKLTVKFKGRMIAYSEKGEAILNRFIEDLQDIGIVEKQPKLEGRNMILVMAPKK